MLTCRFVKKARGDYLGLVGGGVGVVASRPWGSFANVPAPASKHMDHLGRHRRRQGHSHEDEALVDCIRKRQLRCQACG